MGESNVVTKKPKQSKILIDIANTHKFYSDENRLAYVEYSDSSSTTIFVPVKSEEYRNELRSCYFDIVQDLPNKMTLSDVIDFLSVEKAKVGQKVKIFSRFGILHNTYYINQTNQQATAIEIDSTGWRIKDKSLLPVKFRSLTTQRPIVDPIAGGDPLGIFEYMPFSGNKQMLLAMACLCAIPIRNIVRPIIALQGTEGSGKTTVAKLLRAVFDPSYPEVLSFKKREDEFALVLYQNAVPFFDNLSRLPDHIVEMFCKATTGDGFSKRTLWTDMGLTSWGYKRPIIYTALDSPSVAPDFLDRRVLFELNRLSMSDRLEESLLLDGFKQDLPSILGGCLDLISRALEIHPNLNLHRLPRLADFAKFGTAIAMALGHTQSNFIDILNDNVNANKLMAISKREPIVPAIISFVNDNITWTGKTSELLKFLSINYRPASVTNWPNSAGVFGKRLKDPKIVSLLSENSVIIDQQRVRTGTEVTVSLDSHFIEDQLIAEVVEEIANCIVNNDVSANAICLHCANVSNIGAGTMYYCNPNESILNDDEIDCLRTCDKFTPK